jgi:integrase
MTKKWGELMKFVQPIRDLNKIEEVKFALENNSLRDYMVFMIGINLGRRVSDIVNLKAKQLRDRDRFIIKEKKTGKETYLLIPVTLQKDLKNYLKKFKDDDYIFPSRQGRNIPISPKRVYQILKRAANICNLDNIGTHSMRKTFGYFHYQAFKDVAQLMLIFNHDDQRTTLRYIGIEQDQIDASMRKFGL